MSQWQPPESWSTMTSIEAHTAGEPLRIISAGLPEIPGATMLAKRRYFREHLDAVRTGLMWEPRGHADMYGAVITEAVTDDGDLGVLFLHNEGYSSMCGHGIIALTKVVLDTGMITRPGQHPVLRIDALAGRIVAVGHRSNHGNGNVTSVSFTNVPSFVLHTGLEIDLPGVGRVVCDIAYGGAFYAFCDVTALGLELTDRDCSRLIDLGRKIKHAVSNHTEIVHPDADDLGFLYGTIFIGPALDQNHHSRNVCIFADGEVDRSPTGTGVSARAAIHHQRGELSVDQPITIESFLGTCFEVTITGTTTCGKHAAVIPEVTGRASITGCNQHYFDPDDPLRDGFILR